MKKLILFFTLIGSVSSIYPIILYSDYNNGFYSSEKTVNLIDYNWLCIQVSGLATQYRNSNIKEEDIYKNIASYLKKLNSPEAIQLLEDINESTFNGMGFNSFIFGLGINYIFLKSDPDFVKTLQESFVKNSEIKSGDIDDYIRTYTQMVLMVHMYWQNGWYSQKTYEQVADYLESLNTRAAKFFLKKIHRK